MINLHESMGPGWDRTRDPWICSQTQICCQTHYRLCYLAWYDCVISWSFSLVFPCTLMYRYSSFLQTDREDTDQTGQMPRLISLPWMHRSFCQFHHRTEELVIWSLYHFYSLKTEKRAMSLRLWYHSQGTKIFKYCSCPAG